jgi:putative ABC transport system substrate-binding protein
LGPLLHRSGQVKSKLFARVFGISATLRANIVIEFRWAEGKYDRLPMLARGLAALDVDGLVTHTTPGVRAAKQATTRIPIVIAAAGDAVAAGLVESIARPGGNITGSSFFVPELASKRLGLLKEAFPHVKRVGILFNPVGIVQTATWGDAMASAAKSLAIEMQEIPVREPEHFEGALVSAVGKGFDALAMSEDPVLVGNARPIVDVVARLRLPVIGFLEFGEAGGLMAYGASIRNARPVQGSRHQSAQSQDLLIVCSGDRR